MADTTKAEKPEVVKSSKPDKPNEEVYQKELVAAEKALEAAKTRLVSIHLMSHTHTHTPTDHSH
jgi:hypothetical protein